MRIRRINEQTSSDRDIQDWFTKHCKSIYPSNFYSHVSIKEDGVHVKTHINFYRMESPPPFKISSLAGDVKIEASKIKDFSFLPKTINGNLELTTTDINSVEGFPTMIYGNLELSSCMLIESFNNLESSITGSIHINNVPSLKELKAENIKFRGAGVIIRGAGITTLKGLPSSIRLTHKVAPYFHISECPIKNLAGLPEKASQIYISKCPLESIEGIPFDITEGFRSAVNITPSSEGNREKVYKQIDLYYETLEKIPFKSHPAGNLKDERASYIKRILEENPEVSSIIPQGEIPKDLKGQKILKRLDLF
jgi:hypothetical protein